MTLQYSNNTTPITAANYSRTSATSTFSGTVEAAAISGGTSFTVGAIATSASTLDFDFLNVSAGGATRTPGLLHRKVGAGGTGGFNTVNGGGMYVVAAQTTGFGVTISAGTITGELKVYGKRSA